MLGLKCHKREMNLKRESENERFSAGFQSHLSCWSSGLQKLFTIKVPFEHMWIMPFVKVALLIAEIKLPSAENTIFFPSLHEALASHLHLETLCPWLSANPPGCLKITNFYMLFLMILFKSIFCQPTRRHTRYICAYMTYIGTFHWETSQDINLVMKNLIFFSRYWH